MESPAIASIRYPESVIRLEGDKGLAGEGVGIGPLGIEAEGIRREAGPAAGIPPRVP